jgi:hypothetical protein
VTYGITRLLDYKNKGILSQKACKKYEELDVKTFVGEDSEKIFEYKYRKKISPAIRKKYEELDVKTFVGEDSQKIFEYEYREELLPEVFEKHEKLAVQDFVKEYGSKAFFGQMGDSIPTPTKKKYGYEITVDLAQNNSEYLFLQVEKVIRTIGLHSLQEIFSKYETEISSTVDPDDFIEFKAKYGF